MEGKSSFGPYSLISRLSTGGMAEVYRARDTRPENDGRIVALKTILATRSDDDDIATMFEDEARIASRLDHPNIAKVFEWGAHAGRMFIAYELVEGKDLRVVFENAALTGEAPPLPVVLHVIRSVADALAYAHAQKEELVHRDVSPQNVVLSFEGDVKLIDFGIAKARGRLSRTDAGTIKGKFGYMSPEQVRGEEVDQRTDVFSLGICAWEMLTLRRLFLPATLSAADVSVNEILVLDMVKNHFPDPPSSFALQVPPELDRIVMKALAKNPDERYKSARELYRDLHAFIENEPTWRSGATREDVAKAMRHSFGEHRTGRIMELQETRMSDENKGGSDLDIFEGLGKKSSERNPAAAPPPPPGSGQHIAAPRSNSDMAMKKTLLGIPGPAPTQPTLPGNEPSSPASVSSAPASRPPASRPPAPPSGTMRAASPSSSPAASPSKPPPPPGRGSLPNIAGGSPASQPPQSAAAPATQSSPPSATQRVSGPPPVPPPASTRPGPAGVLAKDGPTSQSVPAAAKKVNGGKLDMDWDDDDEATHVFDKEKEKSAPSVTTAAAEKEPERADIEHIMSQPPPPPARASSQIPAAAPVVTGPPPPATLSGAFAQLGTTQPSQATNGSASFKSAPPASQSMRSAPPPPPASVSPSAPPARSQSTSTHPIPPPPPPGQVTTAPMHMPASSPPPAHQQARMPSGHPSAHPSAPPHAQVQSVPPGPQLPPVSRNMEATAVVPRQPESSKTGLVVALLAGVALVAAAIVFLVMPRTATLVVNVADNHGAPVKGLAVSVDDKTCSSSPCIFKDLASGVHTVKVDAAGYDPVAPSAITIEARKDVTRDVTLVAAKQVAGTGFKVSGNQAGVKLVVDGKDIGPLPQELRDLEPGDHKVKFVGGDRYQPMEKTISVAKDEILDLGNVQLKVLKGKATINLGTPGAKVYLVQGTNRKEVPQFPMGIEFDPNEKWTLEATKDGYEPFTQPITWDDGQAEKTFTVTLTPKGSSAPAVVAHAPATQPATRPVVAAKQPAVPDPNGDAEPAPKKEPAKKEPAAAPAAGEAFLNINSLPASTVVLDGKPLGPTPKVHVSVQPGSHTVMFVNAEQSLKKSITVDVKAGETKAAFAKLRE